MFKRLAVAASVSAVALLGFVPVASASPEHTTTAVVSLQKPAKFKIVKAIDWDAPPSKGIAVQRSIDWD